MYAARAAVVVPPSDLAFNEETAPDNPFMTRETGMTLQEVRKRATREFDNMVRLVRKAGISVYVFDRRNYRDLRNQTFPDGVYPNWWLTDTNNSVWLMPMCCPSRNAEKQLAPFVLETLMKDFHVSSVCNFASNGSASLEGIGSLVIDRYKRRVYCAISRRSDPILCRKWAADAGYEHIIFETSNSRKKPFYHTDLLLALGDRFAVVCAKAIKSKHRKKVLQQLAQDREVIEISMQQAEKHYCANIIQMANRYGQLFVVMSQSAFKGFKKQQLAALRKYGQLIVCPLPTIETVGGGSLHCVLQEIFLTPKVRNGVKCNGLTNGH